MSQLKTLQIAVYGALAGAGTGSLGLLVDPGRNDVTLVWIWIAMAGLSAVIGAALAGAVSGTWNLYARHNPES
jgi:hypothetical protein